MNKHASIALILSLALTLPAFAGGGGGRGGRGGGGQGGQGGFGGQGGQGGFGGQGGQGFGGQGGQGGFGAQGNFTVQGGGQGGRQPTQNQTTRTPTQTRTPTNPNPLGSMTGGSRQVQLTEEYSILDSTSIFAQNRRAISADSNIIDPNEIRIEPPQPQVVVPRGNAPVFRAYYKDDQGPMALLESQDRSGMGTNQYIREGQIISWNGSKVLSISQDAIRINIPSNNGLPFTDIPINHTVEGAQSSDLPSVASYQSGDALGQVSGQTAGGRGGAGGGGGRGGRGGAGGGNTFQQGGGAFNTTGIGAGAINLGINQQTLVNPSLDPPLPAGSADSIAERMAQRRLMQLNSDVTPATPAPGSVPAPGATPVTPTPGAPGAAPATPATPATPAGL